MSYHCHYFTSTRPTASSHQQRATLSRKHTQHVVFSDAEGCGDEIESKLSLVATLASRITRFTGHDPRE